MKTTALGLIFLNVWLAGWTAVCISVVAYIMLCGIPFQDELMRAMKLRRD